MNDASQAITGIFGMWMLLQLGVLLALLLGGLYALYCLGRAAAGLDRLASAVEQWVERQAAQGAPPLPGAPGGGMRPSLVPPSSPVPAVPLATVPATTTPTATPLRPMEVPLATPPIPSPMASPMASPVSSPMVSPISSPAPLGEVGASGETTGEARQEQREI